jgi:DNA-directed RNA polymerase specialized sigma24 family protein
LPNLTISVMTFITAQPEGDILSDADLARAAAAGDCAALAGIYNRYAARLHDYCLGLVRDHHAAADCVQDVCCTAAAELLKLRDPDKLRPWLYAIARRTALRGLHERRREPAFGELPDSAAIGPGPFTVTAQNELAQLIAQAAGGLSERDRRVSEVVEVVGSSEMRVVNYSGLLGRRGTNFHHRSMRAAGK